jgi:hypothetical protein
VTVQRGFVVAGSFGMGAARRTPDMQLPFDPDDPPADPPPGSDRALWVMSHSLWAAHQPDPDGICVVKKCRDAFMLWPCHSHRIASAGLIGASLGWVPIPGRRRALAVPPRRRGFVGPIDPANTWT